MKIPPVSLAALAALTVGLGVLVTRSQSPAAPDAPPTPAETPGTDPAAAEPPAAAPADTQSTPAPSAAPAFPVPPVPSSTRMPVRPPAATPRTTPTGTPAAIPSPPVPTPGTVRPRTTSTTSPAAQPALPVPPPARLPASPAAQPAVPGFPPAGVPPAAGAAAVPGAGASPLAASAAAGGTGAAGAGADGLIAPGVLALQMADIEQVLTIYAEFTQRTVLRTTALPKVSVMLSNQTPWTTEEAIQALDTVLAMNGITMLNVGEKFVSAVPSNTVLQEGGAFSSLNPKDLSETGQFVTKVVKVKHALPSELQQIISGFSKTQNGILAIDSTMTLVLRDYPANVKRMTEILEEVDVEVERDYKLEVIPIKYGKVDEIYGTMSALIGGSGAGVGTGAGAVARTTGVGRTSSRAMRGGTGYSSRVGGSGLGGYSSGAYRNPLGGYYPQQAAAAPVGTAARPATPNPATTFNQRFQSILNRAAGQQAQQLQLLEDARIVPDERSNSLIVYASKDDMKMITNIVAKVDRLLAQVVIDAIIMDVALTDAYQLGVSWLMNPQQSGNWTSVAASRQGQNLVAGLTNIASGGAGFSYLARFKDDLTVAVEALASNNKGQILSRPRVQTSHAMPAVFSVGQSVPYVTTTSYGGSYYGPQSSFQQLDVSTELNVTPFITPDGLVVMEIDQNIEEISGFEEFPNVGKLPRTVHRYASATVSVRDRETIILGGYIRTSKSKTSSGVPLLKDIPLLGAAFRSKGSDSSRSELIVLIRPTVLITPEDAAAEAEAERNRLPGIREMERSVDEYEENTGARLKTLFGK